MPKRPLTLLHIEDDPLWQDLVRQSLHDLPLRTQMHAAADAGSGLLWANTHRPDIVLLDLWLPDVSGLDLLERLSALTDPTRVILLTARHDEVVLDVVRRRHVAGILWKSGDILHHLSAAVTSVAAGGCYYHPAAGAALRRFRNDPQAFFKILSPRELTLLPRLGGGETDGEIAAALGLSAHTVRSHRYNIMRKLGLPSTARLIHWALTHGFFPPSARDA